MHIKDHSAAMKFFRTYDNVASKGKWKEFVDEMEFDSMLQEPRTMAADGGRIGLFEAGLVTQGENANQWRINNFYSKTKEGKFQPPKGKSSDAFFNSEKEALAAIEKRKKESSHGLSLEELNKKYKKQLKTYGVSSWDKLDNNIRADRLTKQKIKQAYLDEKFPPESVAKWKKEGLTTGLNEKTRKLLATKKPINPATGLPYTLKEFTALKKGQKNILLRRLEGKEPTRAWAVRQGWFPEKKANKLMTYLKHAAKKQENLPLKERNFINVWEGEKFVGVKDVRKNTLWTHIDYDLSKTGAKKGTIITNHPGHENVQFFLKEAEKFKYGKPDKLLGSYFTKYKRVPTYSEMYRFFTVDPQTAGAKKGKAYKINPLHQHHQELMAIEPAKSIQLTLSKQNTEASRILNQFEKGEKGYSFTEANQKLKDVGVRIKGSKGWMGPAKGEITTAKSIEAAQAETIKMFKEAHKNNPKIVDQMTKALKIALKKKGIKGNEAGYITTAMLEDFGKLGLKGGKLLRWLQLEYDVLFESLIYQYHRQYEGQEPEVAREALWLPKIIAKYAPDLWEKAGFKPFKTGVWEGPDKLYEEALIGKNELVKNYIDNQKRMEELSSKWDTLDFQKKGSSRVHLTPEQVKSFENQQAAVAAEYQKLDQLNKPDALTGYHSAYTTALEAQDTERGVKRTEAHKKRLGVEEYPWDVENPNEMLKYDKNKEKKLERAQKRFEEEQADKRRRVVEDKYPTLTKAEVDKKLEDVGLYIDPDLRSYKGRTVQRPEGLKYLGKPVLKPDSRRGLSYDDVRDYWKDLDKQSYYADNFRMEKAEGGIMSLKKKR